MCCINNKILHDPLNLLPIELSNHVLKFLNHDELQSAAKVSTSWRSRLVEIIRHREHKSFKRFIKFLSKHLDNGLFKQKQDIIDSGNNWFLGSKDLKQIDTAALNYRHLILKTLKGLDDDILDRLKVDYKKRRASVYLKDIFDLAYVYKSLDYADLPSGFWY